MKRVIWYVLARAVDVTANIEANTFLPSTRLALFGYIYVRCLTVCLYIQLVYLHMHNNVLRLCFPNTTSL